MREILGIILALCLVAGAGFYVGSEFNQAKVDAKEKEAKKARDEIVNATANKLAAMAPTQAAITERVIREVKTNTVYRDCVLPDSGVRLLNNAIAGTNPEPFGGVGVQTASPQP